MKKHVLLAGLRIEVLFDEPFAPDEPQLAATGLTPRELEILALIAAGLSHREIAERILLSEHTVWSSSG